MSESGGGKRARARKGAETKRQATGARSLALRDGGRLRLSREPEGETLTVVSADGEMRLEVVLTPAGAVLRFAGPRVSIEAGGELSLRCARFEVHAEQISLGASGDVALAAGRGLEIHAGHDALVSAQAVKVEARRGELALEANDDVALNGERVLLNCPTDEEVERRTREAATLKDLLELPFRTPGDPRRLPPSAPVPEVKP
ncbi:MAG: hypothetical protein IPL90_12775 [Holophagales bacterium]|nr:hypothetical protein [Holophagales bacterium]